MFGPSDLMIGDVIESAGQEYQFTGLRQHEKANGEWTAVLVFRSWCAECGAEFECTATQRSLEKGALSRRCNEHKRPGVRVRRKPEPKRKRRA